MFKKCCRTSIAENSEYLHSFLDMFDAVITEAVDSFRGILRAENEDERYIRKKGHNSTRICRKEHAKLEQKTRFGKRRIISQESVISFKVLVQKAAINIHNPCLELSKQNVALTLNQFQEERFMRDVGSEGKSYILKIDFVFLLSICQQMAYLYFTDFAYIYVVYP